MTITLNHLKRAILPVTVFSIVLLAHYLWSGLFPEVDPAQARWASFPASDSLSWLKRYLETQSYWLGYSYALSLAFAAVLARRYWEERLRYGKTLLAGGISFSTLLALAGCFLAGCCGSPMLVVYLNLFGAWFLPLAKPLVAALTTLTILGTWLWMNKRGKAVATNQQLEANICHTDKCQRDQTLSE
jgi:hypothetical protein